MVVMPDLQEVVEDTLVEVKVAVMLVLLVLVVDLDFIMDL
jgi:hypothetical protein